MLEVTLPSIMLAYVGASFVTSQLRSTAGKGIAVLYALLAEHCSATMDTTRAQLIEMIVELLPRAALREDHLPAKELNTIIAPTTLCFLRGHYGQLLWPAVAESSAPAAMNKKNSLNSRKVLSTFLTYCPVGVSFCPDDSSSAHFQRKRGVSCRRTWFCPFQRTWFCPCRGTFWVGGLTVDRNEEHC